MEIVRDGHRLLGEERRLNAIRSERASAGRERVERAAERENVGARIDVASDHLLRWHVERRAPSEPDDVPQQWKVRMVSPVRDDA